MRLELLLAVRGQYVERPNNTWMIRTSTPASIKCVANEWRNVRGVIQVPSPAASAAS
jgi:hypothetical protein